MRNQAEYLFDFPEVAELGFGYTKKRGKRGAGVGTYTQTLILDALAHSPELQKRGVRHVEEMQLFSKGIGPDGISDMTGNILKGFLVSYTQRQCRLWTLPMKPDVPVAHVYDTVSQEWMDTFEELPVSPADGSAVLLVPRRWVRVLPWINYDHFARTELAPYLKSRRRGGRVPSVPNELGAPLASVGSKERGVEFTRADVTLVDRYVDGRERAADQLSPSSDYLDGDVCARAGDLSRALRDLPSGHATAGAYQRLVLEILNFLFVPELADGRTEVRTIDGTERRDIIFTNESDLPFWDYVRGSHDGILLMFETKNTTGLTPDAINQTATYLGDRLGRLGVIVTRESPSEAILRKAISVWNDSGSDRKVILILCDSDLDALLKVCCDGGSTTKWVQAHYRNFRTSAQ